MLDIWSLARQQHLEECRQRIVRQRDPTISYSGLTGSDLQTSDIQLIICGSKNCGKTSMILRFLNRNEDAKSTIALEYTYGRRNRGKVKDVVHIWELGGGTNLSNLLQIPLSSNHIQQCCVMIVIDLTAPFDMWNTFYTLIDNARVIVDSAMQQLVRKSPDSYEAYVDAEHINIFPIPLIVLGAKYDEFQDFEPEQRKNICKFMRYMAHMNGATLVMSSNRMENLITKTRVFISSVVFGTTAPKTICTDHNKPLSVPCGADSLTEIGTPPFIHSSLALTGAMNSRDLWHESYLELFPAKEKHGEKEDIATENGQHREPELDRLIEQRTRELEQYMRHKKDRAALETKTERNILGNL